MRYLKDCNECLVGGIALELMQSCLERALDFAPEKVVSAEQFREAFIERLLGGEKGEEGLELPFEFPFRIRRGEMTVWTGFEKSGKSTLLDYVVVCLMAQGERAMVASFEMTPVETLEKMARQAFGGHVRADKEEVDRVRNDPKLLEKYREEVRERGNRVFDWLAPKLWIYDHLGIGNWRQLLEDIGWARRQHGITQFAVDNFMRLGIQPDKWEEQAIAITAFASAAMELDCHIHMVVHQNKEGRKGKSPDGAKGTVAGAYQITANAHNIAEVQRDVNKGELVDGLYQRRDTKMFKGQEEFAKEKAKLDIIPDGKLVLHAARNGDRQNAGRYLWFLPKAQQYVVQPPGGELHAPTVFVKSREDEAREAKQDALPSSEEGM